MAPPSRTYPPLDTLKQVDEGVWIVDGPVIRFGLPGLKFSFPTRMTILRLEGGLLLHSPTRCTEPLLREVRALGTPRWIVGPNRVHYWWIPEWQEAFPAAEVHLAPRILEQAPKGHFTRPTSTIESETGHAWDAEVATLTVSGDFMTEVILFHRKTRTLVLTDLIENLEVDKLDGALERWVTRVGGMQDPDGQTPIDIRLTYWRQRAALRAAVETMITWDPARLILSHGRWYPERGAEELRRAFRWVRS